MEETKTSIVRGMDNEDVVDIRIYGGYIYIYIYIYIHTHIYICIHTYIYMYMELDYDSDIKKNEILHFPVIHRDLDMIILSEEIRKKRQIS